MRGSSWVSFSALTPVVGKDRVLEAEDVGDEKRPEVPLEGHEGQCCGAPKNERTLTEPDKKVSL